MCVCLSVCLPANSILADTGVASCLLTQATPTSRIAERAEFSALTLSMPILDQRLRVTNLGVYVATACSINSPKSRNAGRSAAILLVNKTRGIEIIHCTECNTIVVASHVYHAQRDIICYIRVCHKSYCSIKRLKHHANNAT